MSISRKLIFCALLWIAAFSLAPAAERARGVDEQSFLLTEADVEDFAGLIVRIRGALDPVSDFIREKCSQRTIGLLHSYRPGTIPGDDLKKALLNDLNSILLGESIYDERRFAGLPLSSEIYALISESPEGVDRVRLNRMLLDQAYAQEFAEPPLQPIDVRADSLEYDSEKGLFIAHGRVMLRQRDVTLRSELAVLNLETHDVYAEGDVFFEHGNEAWSGDRLRYNFKTQRGSFGEFVSFLDPFYICAADSYRVSEKEYLFYDAIVTTCEGDDPFSYIRTKKLTVVPGRHAYGRNVLLYMGGVPVLYSPYWRQNIGSPNFFSVVPGYNSRMYAFLLTAFNYRLSRHVETATHLDYRIRRGPGIGQDFLWSSSGYAKGLSTERYMKDEDDFLFFGRKTPTPHHEEEDSWFGDFIAYYTRDSWPTEGKTQKYPIDENRYRLRFYHNHSLGERGYFLSQLNYLSDPRVIEHFFREEYKHAPEPENYIILGYRGDKFNASLQLDKRLNDFYTTVDRLPEASLDITRQELGDSALYYEGKTAAGYLQRQWESAETNKFDYSAFRMDSDNKLYYSMKWFKFLNVTPRAGYRATIYSETKEDVEEIVTTTEIDPDGFEIETAVTNIVTRNLGADFRSVYELGVESSFKAFRVWEAYPAGVIYNLRHIAEPYINYTYVPEPNILPENLYQFDRVDTIRRKHDVKLGMMNKFQTKRRDTVVDLVNADIWSYYRFEPEEDENEFSNIRFDLRSTLIGDWMSLRIDGEFDQYEPAVERFNTRLTLESRGLWRNQLEHRYRRGSNSLLYDEFSISPFANWRYSMYGRYELEEQDLEAWGVSVERVIDCITVRLGVEMEEDHDYRVWVHFWFTEFPRAKIGSGV